MFITTVIVAYMAYTRVMCASMHVLFPIRKFLLCAIAFASGKLRVVLKIADQSRAGSHFNSQNTHSQFRNSQLAFYPSKQVICDIISEIRSPFATRCNCTYEFVSVKSIITLLTADDPTLKAVMPRCRSVRCRCINSSCMSDSPFRMWMDCELRRASTPGNSQAGSTILRPNDKNLSVNAFQHLVRSRLPSDQLVGYAEWPASTAKSVTIAGLPDNFGVSTLRC